jgi:N-methylhydantoinase A
MTSLRVRAVGKTPKPRLQTAAEGAKAPRSEALAQPRQVYWHELGGQHRTPVYHGERLAPGSEVQGPAIIDLPDTTLTVRPHDRVHVDRFGSLILHVGKS